MLLALLGTIADSQTASVIWKRLLWVVAVLLVIYSLLGIGTIGLLLLPAAALVLLAALFSLGNPTTATG